MANLLTPPCACKNSSSLAFKIIANLEITLYLAIMAQKGAVKIEAKSIATNQINEAK